jgi:hypothetical protein
MSNVRHLTMSEASRYAPPKTAHLIREVRNVLSETLEKLFTGRSLLMVSLLAIACGLAVQWALEYADALFQANPKAFALLWVSGVATVLVLGPVIAIVAAFRLAGALGHSNLHSFVLACLMVPPVINVGVIAWLIVRANKALKAGGHRVGVFGLRHY